MIRFHFEKITRIIAENRWAKLYIKRLVRRSLQEPINKE